MINTKNIPNSTAGLRTRALTDYLKDSLNTYHQLEGKNNHSGQDGVQFNSLVAPDEKALKKDVAALAAYVSQQPNVEYRPSPAKDPERKEFRQDLSKRTARWVKDSAQQMLEQATAQITDPALRTLVQTSLSTVPKEFYEAPSSSSSRYHPADEINVGGLVLHTCRVVAMAQHVGDYYGVTPKERDILTAGLILHDSCKGGEPWLKYAPNHGDVAAAHIKNTPGGDTADGKLVQQVAANHMAQWTQTASGQHDARPPANKLDQIASYADYLAAQDDVNVTPPGYTVG